MWTLTSQVALLSGWTLFGIVAGIVKPLPEFLPGILAHLMKPAVEAKFHPSITDPAVKEQVRRSAAYTLERVVRMSKMEVRLRVHGYLSLNTVLLQHFYRHL